MVRLILFAAFSGVLLHISRASITNARSHGFFRFFAWESILALILLNIGEWFRDPLAPHQVASWILLAASLVPGVPGVYFLRTRGLPNPDQRQNDGLVGIEKTTHLVTTGPFRYIRHPLYTSLLLLAWGVFFKNPSGAGAALALGASAFLLAAARAEEIENLRFFGHDYRSYMQRTKRFIPFVF